MLNKTIEFKNFYGQKVRVIEIPVLSLNHSHYFMIQIHLQNFLSSLYEQPHPKRSYSFRDYLKRKLKWSDYEDVFSLAKFKKIHNTMYKKVPLSEKR